MAIDSNIAGVVRVAYEADTGRFNSEVDAAARNYVQGNQHMSDSAVKLELAQDRLRRAVARGPAASREQQRALLGVRQAERELAAETARTTAQIDRQGRELDQTARRAGRAGGAFRGLRSAFGFATAGLLGTTGLVYGLRSVFEAGKEAEASQGRVAVAVRNAGIEYGRYRDQIDRTITKQSQLSAFDDEDLADSFAKLVIRTKDVNEALRLNALVADVARGRNISLEAATQLVIKASLNQAGQLRRVGIEVGKNTTAQELLNKLTEAYSGQAARYGREGAGAQERLRVSIENTEETIARGLLPTVTNLSNEISDWLGKSKNQERIQRDVNTAVKTGTAVVRGLAEGLKVAKAAAEPLVDALGGVENTVKAVGLLWLGFKAKALLGFAGTAAASRATSARMVADAAVAGRAWDVATRPRVMSVTTVGGGVPAGGRGAPVPTTTPKGRFPSLPTILARGAGRNVAIAEVAAILLTPGAQSRRDAYDPKRYPRIARSLAQAERTGEYPPGFLDVVREALGGNFNGKSIRDLTPAQLQRIETNLAPQRVGAEGGDRASDRPNAGRPASVPKPPARPRGSNRPTPRTIVDIQTDIARELTRPGTGPEEKLYREQVGRYRAQIDALEKRKSLTDEQKQTLQGLYADLGQAQGALDGIAEDREQALVKQRADAAERRRKAAAAREAAALRAERRLTVTSPRLKRIRDREIAARATPDRGDDVAALQDDVKFWQGRLAELKKGTAAYEYVQGEIGKARDKLTAARAKAVQKAVKATQAALPGNTPYANTSSGFAKGGISPEKARGSSSTSEKGLTEADIRRMQAEFLSSLQGITNQFGSNLWPAMLSQVGPQSVVQTDLLRKQNGLIEGLTRGVQHPGARYARTELMLPFGDVGGV